MRTHEPPPIPDDIPVKMRKLNEGNASKLPNQVTRRHLSDHIAYECYLCNLKYKLLGALHNHMNLHTGGQRVVFHFCSICRMKVDRTKMDHHVCGANDFVQCEYCTKRFTGTAKLLKHLNEMHKTKRRMYQCEKCVRHFPMVFLKDSHQDSHANEPEEYMKFAKQFKGHIPSPERAKDHLCEECGKTFTTGGHWCIYFIFKCIEMM